MYVLLHIHIYTPLLDTKCTCFQCNRLSYSHPKTTSEFLLGRQKMGLSIQGDHYLPLNNGNFGNDIAT